MLLPRPLFKIAICDLESDGEIAIEDHSGTPDGNGSSDVYS